MAVAEPGSPDEVAVRLTDALESADPVLLAPLLHPRVRWGGEEETPETCHTSSDVLAWYGRLRDAGVRAKVFQVDVREHAVILGIALTGRDGGPRGPRPDRVFQVFRLTHGLIVDIRGYPDRELALAAADTAL